MKNRVNNSLFDKQLMKSSLADSFRKLDPRQMIKNPIMFTVEVVTLVMLVMIGYIAVTGDESQGSLLYNIVIFIVLFATIIFANFAEADGDKEDDADKDVVQADIIDAVGGPEELGEDGEQQSDDKADLNHKHDRIVHHIFGVQLGERPDNRGLEDVLCYEFGPMLIFHRESVILL